VNPKAPILRMALLLLTCLAAPARADFSFAASPPRFELAAKPGERIRQVLEITNVSRVASGLSVRTADWEFQKGDTVVFHDALQPGSCRPWVAIERRELTVGPGQPYRFRFEVTPPAGQAPVECRFAILLEGKEATSSTGATPPVAGRLGVIVYVAVGDVQPQLSVTGARVEMRNGQPVAVLDIRNSGGAHGRLDGFLKAVDGRGRALDAAPAGTPIMPGETRPVALQFTLPGDANTQVPPEWPLTLRGKLEWGKGQGTEVDRRFAP
jgi:hypothetical protein